MSTANSVTDPRTCSKSWRGGRVEVETQTEWETVTAKTYSENWWQRGNALQKLVSGSVVRAQI